MFIIRLAAELWPDESMFLGIYILVWSWGPFVGGTYWFKQLTIEIRSTAGAHVGHIKETLYPVFGSDDDNNIKGAVFIFI